MSDHRASKCCLQYIASVGVNHIPSLFHQRLQMYGSRGTSFYGDIQQLRCCLVWNSVQSHGFILCSEGGVCLWTCWHCILESLWVLCYDTMQVFIGTMLWYYMQVQSKSSRCQTTAFAKKSRVGFRYIPAEHTGHYTTAWLHVCLLVPVSMMN